MSLLYIVELCPRFTKLYCFYLANIQNDNKEFLARKKYVYNYMLQTNIYGKARSTAGLLAPNPITEP